MNRLKACIYQLSNEDLSEFIKLNLDFKNIFPIVVPL